MKNSIILMVIVMIFSVGCAPVEKTEIVDEMPPVVYVTGTPFAQDLIEEMFEEKALMNKDREKPQLKISTDLIFDSSRPIAVMIDNHFMARPQSALAEAKIIYEVLAEGPITRYMIILDQSSDAEIGPVRSARPYFIGFAMEYDSLYAHVGGSEDAKSMIRAKSIDNLNGLSAGSNVYWRTSHKSMPHNLYTSVSALKKESIRLRYPAETDDASALMRYSRSVEIENGDGLYEFAITYKAKTNSDPEGYIVKYVYNADNKVYERYINGKRQKDENSEIPIDAGNIIIQMTDHRVIDSAGRREIDTVGQGKGFYVTNGKYETITWEKKSYESPTLYLNQKGERIIFNPGKIFIQVIEYESQFSIR